MMIRDRVGRFFGQEEAQSESFDDVVMITVSTGYIGAGEVTLWFKDERSKAFASDAVRGIMTLGRELTVLEEFHADFWGDDEQGDLGYRLRFKTPIKVDYNPKHSLLTLKK